MTSIWRPLSQTTDGSGSGLFDHPWGHYAPSAMQRLLIGLTQKTFLQRGALRAMMARRIVGLGTPLDIAFRGCRYRIEGRNNLIETGILTRPSYNGEEIDFLQEVVRDGGVGVDIGCNIGLYALPMAQAAGPDGHVIAIDANPDMIEHVRFNAEASGLGNLRGVHRAVGADTARVDLRIRLDDVAIVKVEHTEDGDVQMQPLVDILAEAGIGRVDGLKIDIEGFEDAALVPFLQTAPEAMLPRRIVIETAGPQGDYPGCVAEFERLGYRLKGRTRNNSMYARDGA